MNLVTWNVARHVLAQVGAAAALGAVTSITHTDWSALGAYAPLVASIVSAGAALATSLLNEVLGTSPTK